MDSMLTTVDNPYDPFTQWPQWYQWDTDHGYHTCGLLARVAVVSDDLSGADQEDAIDRAMDEIVSENFSGVHVKVTR